MSGSSWARAAELISDGDGDGADNGSSSDFEVDQAPLMFRPEDHLSTRTSQQHSSATCKFDSGVAVGAQAPSKRRSLKTLDLSDWPGFVQAASDLRIKRGEQMRPLTVVSLCSGLGTEAFCLRQLGIEHKTVLSSDIKKNAFFIQCETDSFHSQKPEYFCPDIYDLIGSMGSLSRADDPRCAMKNEPIHWQRIAKSLPGGRPDLLVSGFPCQPFTTARSRERFARGGVHSHPKYSTGEAVRKCIQEMRPVAFLLENVTGMNKGKGGLRTPLEDFLDQLKKLGGYVFQSYSEDLAPWVDCALRDRFFIVGLESRAHSQADISSIIDLIR
ncbi:unnamed protein product, partial [Prorocentrum cordatum]